MENVRFDVGKNEMNAKAGICYFKGNPKMCIDLLFRSASECEGEQFDECSIVSWHEESLS